MSHTISIDGRRIAPDAPPYVIAEMSANHDCRLDRALAIVDAARAAGASAVKLQTYTPDTITLDSADEAFRIRGGLWDGRTLHELYGEAHLPWDWHAPLFAHAQKVGITMFSTPFDTTAVDLLEDLGAPAYKIASFEAVDLPLIRYVAATGKPMIISTGMATVSEIDEAVTTARAAGAKDIVLLKCTSTYPASPENSNIATIPNMRDLFGCQVGLSDHTMGTGVAVAAVAHGATVVEKHFTLSRADGGVDSAFSLEPAELAALVAETGRAWHGLGRVSYGPTEAEKKSLLHRRSLYVAQDMKAGDVFTAENLRVVRPGEGLHPRHYEQLLGRRISRDARRGTPMSWDLL
jgi:pseudaminic acid synthase